jgi:hypothetical protein
MRSPDGKPIGVRPAGITAAAGEPRAEQIAVGMCRRCAGDQHCSHQHANDKHAVSAFQALTSSQVV